MNDFSMILSMTPSSTMLAPRWFDRRQEGLGFQDHKNNNNNDKKTVKINHDIALGRQGFGPSTR
jgi:hypothetical protein